MKAFLDEGFVWERHIGAKYKLSIYELSEGDRIESSVVINADYERD